jgi:hypothetical protein
VWCALMKDKVIGPFFFEEPAVTGDTYLRHVTVATVSQTNGAPPHFSRRVRAFLDRGEFPDRCIGRVLTFAGPCHSTFDSSGFFILRGLWSVFFMVTECKMCMNCVTESSELQSELPVKCLQVLVQKLNVVLMCVVPLMVPVLRLLNS